MKLVPLEALAYLKGKKLRKGFSYLDVWQQEHAVNFTVAKAMQLDILSDIKGAVEQAIENGETLESFRKKLKPVLQEKGWWGRQEMQDPLTGKTVNAQLGSDRRLKTIYDTNTRSAYQRQRWEHAQASPLHPYLLYRIGPSVHHRKEHLAWDGLILPKDDPWWDSHFPPNGWGCKCWTQAITEERKAQLEKTGIIHPPTLDGKPGYTSPVKTEPPKTTYKTFVNVRRGTVEHIPVGVDPAFNWNVGKAGRNVDELTIKMEETRGLILDELVTAEKIKNIAGIKTVSLPRIPNEVQEGILDGYKKVLGRYPQLYGKFALLDDTERVKKAYAACLPYNGSISVNKKFFGKITDIAKSYENDVKAGWHPAETDWKSIIVHEIGHRVHDILTQQYLVKTGGVQVETFIRQKVFSNLNISWKDVEAELSGYAVDKKKIADRDKEFFAEAFAEYISSKKPRRLAEEVGKMVDLMMKGKLP